MINFVLAGIIEYVVSFIEILILYRVLCNLFGEKKNYIASIVYSILLTTFVFLLNLENLFSYFITSTIILYITISVRFLSRGKFKDIIIIAAFYYVLVILMDFLGIAVGNILFSTYEFGEKILTRNSLYRVAYIIVMKLLLSLIYLLIRNYIPRWKCFYKDYLKQILIICVIGIV